MGAIKADSKYQTPREKAIAHALQHPDVNREIADKYIAACCAEIQAGWSAAEEEKRRRWSLGPGVETTRVEAGYRRKGVKQLLGD